MAPDRRLDGNRPERFTWGEVDGTTTKGTGEPAADADFVARYEGLVQSLARKLCAELGMRPEETEDLAGWGMQGLLEARDRFDASRGVQFHTFAYYRIRGAMLDGVRKMTHLPRRIVAKARAMGGADLVGEELGDRRAAAHQAGATTGPDPVQGIDEALNRITTAFLTAYQRDVAVEEASPEEQVQHGQMLGRLREALDALPEREATLLRGIYFEDRTLDDIGRQLGVSRSWACRMHARALDHLREALGVET